MLTLVIESCTARSIVAILEDTTVLYMAALPLGFQQSRYLLPKVIEGLNSLACEPFEIDRIVAGIGPGSYTGIRLGASVAKALSFASSIPLIGICTLKGFIPDQNGNFISLIDAKMSGVYMLLGKRDNGKITYLGQPMVCVLDDLDKHLAKVHFVVGPNFSSLQKKILSKFPTFKGSWQEMAPDPVHLTRLALEKFETKQYSLDGTLEIFYLRGNP